MTIDEQRMMHGEGTGTYFTSILPDNYFPNIGDCVAWAMQSLGLANNGPMEIRYDDESSFDSVFHVGVYLNHYRDGKQLALPVTHMPVELTYDIAFSREDDSPSNN